MTNAKRKGPGAANLCKCSPARFSFDVGGLVQPAKGLRKMFHSKPNFETKILLQKTGNQLSMQMSKQSQPNHSIMKQSCKQTAWEAKDTMSQGFSSGAVDGSPQGAELRSVGRPSHTSFSRGLLLTWGHPEGRVSGHPGRTSCVDAVFISPGRMSGEPL